MTNPEYATRPYATDDAEAVLALIGADRVPGQPAVTHGILDDAVAGRAPIDGAWWAELTGLST
ncbi:MAG: GNAT family N-acetyltransferase, partial [Sciscionella sp.]